MTATSPLAESVAAFCTRLAAEEPLLADAAHAIGERLRGPIRIAIAGRVKAGKSTLLNALVGERLAPTDAGECTRVVTVYEHGITYSVDGCLRSGTRVPLGFHRVDGALSIDLGAHSLDDLDRLEVRWPAPTLRDLVLVDTPGLESISSELSRRTLDFLGARSADHSFDEADAVIYLMRHVHTSDVEFLDAFMDRTVTAASPVNAVAVLSRADEIGAGRLDAMESAARIARRYERSEELRPLVSAVLPLAGLLAETGLTLREDEALALRRLASTEPDQLERMLLSVDELLEVSASELTVEIRRHLLERLGVFGVRIALREIAHGATTAATLGPRLVEQSGLPQLRRVVAERFGPRARVLQARTALAGLRHLADLAEHQRPEAAAAIRREVERLESTTLEFARLRSAHLVASGRVRASDQERADLERLLLVPGPLGLGPELSDAPPDEIRARAVAALAHWRDRGADPLADRAWAEVCDTAARACEAIYAQVAGSGDGL
jgi:hypothetical protein